MTLGQVTMQVVLIVAIAITAIAFKILLGGL